MGVDVGCRSTHAIEPNQRYASKKIVLSSSAPTSIRSDNLLFRSRTIGTRGYFLASDLKALVLCRWFRARGRISGSDGWVGMKKQLHTDIRAIMPALPHEIAQPIDRLRNLALIPARR